MKLKFLITVFALSCSCQIYAQNKRFYCEIKGTQKQLSSRMKIIFDFGQNSSYSIWTNLNPMMKFVDKKGEEIDFNSMVDAMNYMSERGWKFQQAYSTHKIKEGSTAIEHWILYKDANTKEEAREGILTKEEYEKLQRTSNDQ